MPPADLGSALAKQFAVVDQSLDAVVRTLNAQNERLEKTIRRQRIWNVSLAAGVVGLFVVVLWSLS